MYKVTLLPDAEKSFKKLDKPVQQRISEKIDWLARNADTIIHHPLVSLPDDLKGLCRIRVGDYRILKIIRPASSLRGLILVLQTTNLTRSEEHTSELQSQSNLI